MACRTAFALCLLALVSNAAAFGRTLLQPIDPVYSAAIPAPWTGAGYKWGSNSTALSKPSGINPTNGLPVTANGPWRAGDTFVTYAPGFSSGVASGDPLPGRVILWTRFQPAGDQSAMAAADPANIAYAYAYTPDSTISIPVSWWVSTSASGSSPAASGTYTTDGTRDWTVKLDVNYGTLTAGTPVYYSFSATYQNVTYTSPVGSFRAIDGTMANGVNYAVASCSNWGFGAFNAYDMIAKVDNLDFYMHVGDNIYEYNDLNYPDATQKLRTQVTDPPHEIVSLDDYRRRYRLYRTDPSLQLLGATAPLIMTADDHEYTNNPWMTGAQNHQVSGSGGAGFDTTRYPEGDFYVRITNALQAMYEYNPIREQHGIVYTGTSQTGSASVDLSTVNSTAIGNFSAPITSSSTAGYLVNNVQQMPGAPVPNITALTRFRMKTLQRSFTFGQVLTVALTEDRVSYRTSANSALNNGYLSPIGPMDCPSGNVGAFYLANDPLCSPVAQAAVALGMANRSSTGNGITLANPATWTQAQIANLSATYMSSMMFSSTYYNNASQHIIGTTPTNWLGTTFAASKTAGVKFQVWASQTVFMITEATDTYNATVTGRNTSQSLNAVMNPFSGPYAAYSLCTVLGPGCAAAWASMPWNVDGWDGFNYERQAVLNALAQGNNAIVNSGDAHGFWLGTIKGNITTGAPNVVEFAGGSITSQGWGDYFPALNAVNGAPVMGYTLNKANNAFLNVLEDGFTIANAPNGMVASRHLHGALVFKATNSSYIGQVFTIDTMNSTTYNIMCDYAYSVAAGVPGVMNNLASGSSPGCVSTVNGMNGNPGTVPGTFNGTTGANGGYPTTASAPPQGTVAPATAVSGLHTLRWFTGGGGQCIPGMSVADCSYRKLLMRHIKTSLQMCTNPLTTNMMSVSHRGAPLLFPEHTMEGYQQAINDGAGWIECDTVPTKDMQMVCRHSTCDLASTTNVLSIPSLAAKCTVPGSTCCTYDFTLAEYSSLCGKAYGASGPHLQANSWSNGVNAVCNAHPASLVEMAALAVTQGAKLIPEQKNCDLMCQAKLAAYAPNGITCTTGTYCQAAVNKITQTIVSNLTSALAAVGVNSLTPNVILQTFEYNVAKYVKNTYGTQVPVAFLYEFHGQGTQTSQADYYLGYYPVNYTTIGSVASPVMGSATCGWCVNGTSAGGWYDVLALGTMSPPVEYSAPSTADLVRPVGGLMVASDWAKIISNSTSMKHIGWTLERSTAIFGTSPPAPNAWPSSSYSTFDSVGWAYQQHAGQSSLDYEDLLFMLYALRYDVPRFAGVFSDFPASTTVFMNCVPKFEAAMPVNTTSGWANPANPYTTVVRDTSADATPVCATGCNEVVPLSGSHVWRMFAGGGGLCGVAQQDEAFYDYDLVPPAVTQWGSNVSYPQPNATLGVVQYNFNVNFTTIFPNKPNPPLVTTSALDCGYRRKLINWIKNSLATCANPLAPTNFSVSHRGSPMTYPEHSIEGYRAAIGMGAKYIECDTAVTKDLVPVCRHSQCDLHTTTNVLFTPLAAKCSMPFQPAVLNPVTGTITQPAGAMCCTFDFNITEYNSLCAIQDVGSGHPAALTVQQYLPVGSAPFFRSTAYDTFTGTCAATPATLSGMADIVVTAGRNLIPEQKVCDLLCQYKLALANPALNASTWQCTTGVYCQALVNAWTDIIVGVLNSKTNNNNNVTSPNAPLATTASGWVLQTFELNTALYIASKTNDVTCFLYQQNGGSNTGNVAHPYLGFYPQNWTSGALAWNMSVSGTPIPALGAYGLYLVNGSSLGGWPDVYTAIAGGVQAGGISIADLVVPQGALMVASANARKAASLGMVFTPWTLERSSATFGTVSANNYVLGGGSPVNGSTQGYAFTNQVQYPTTSSGYYLNHAGLSSLDYEDMLFMLYALKYDVPNVVGIFSDYPATTTAFGNCVPKMDAAMPVNYAESWSTPPILGGSATTAAVTCNTWIANGGYGSLFAGASACTPNNYAACCSNLNAIFGALSTSSPYSNCFCEADFAGFMLGALGVGNAPAGKGAVYGYGVAPMPTVMATCNALGYNTLFWPNAVDPRSDCLTPQSSGATVGGMLVPANPVAGSSRSPYVMAVTSTSATIRWRTAAAAPSVVALGTSISSLAQAASADAGGVLDHTVVLSGLTAGTVYYYAAGGSLNTTGSAGYMFKTSPAPGGAAGSANVRFWAHGDFGEQTKGVPAATVLDSNAQANVYAAWLAFEASTGRTADAWLALGDNAYNTGSDPLYQYNFFNVYAALLGRTPVYPVIGNHDSYSWMYTPVAKSAYNTAFGSSLLAISGADGPGVASGTMRYYSFNIGRVHVVSLDSMTLRSVNSLPAYSVSEGNAFNPPAYYFPALASVPGFTAAFTAAGQPNQMTWLAADLAAVQAAGKTDWIVCQYHHPSHSDGSHKSDTEIEMIEMRTLYNPILEVGGVDICFHGHSHGYERMLPTAGFYGNQSTFSASNQPAGYVAGTYAGNVSTAAATFAKAGGLTPFGGTTYVVAGSGGQYAPPSGTNYNYVASASKGVSQQAGISLAVDIVGNTLTVTAISGGVAPLAGMIVDKFNITKAALQTLTVSVTLGGYTSATFNVVAQAAFVSGVSTLLGVSASAITITSVTDVVPASGRHLLQSGGIVVTFTVTSSMSLTALTAVMTNSALTAALATAFAASNLAAPSVVGTVSVAAPAAPAAPAPWYEEYNNKKDLGALAILVVLPVGAFGFYWFSPYRKRHFPPQSKQDTQVPRNSDMVNTPMPMYSASGVEATPEAAAAV